MQDIYKVTLGHQVVGFFPANSWNEASRLAASRHTKVAGETLPWASFSATWVNPKRYQEERVPEHLYATDEVAETV